MAPLAFSRTDSLRAAGKESRVVMKFNFCCGITPIIQRAGPSILANTGRTVTSCVWPLRVIFES